MEDCLQATNQAFQRCGRFRRLVTLIKLILRVFGSIYTEPKHQMTSERVLREEGAKQPARAKRHVSLQELSQPQTRLKITERIQHRLHQAAPTCEHKDVSITGHSEHSVLSEQVKEILHNSPWTRTPSQLEQVYQELQCCEAFKDYPAHIQKSLCKLGWYQRVGPGRVILREGHPPSCFYFILLGTVTVTKGRTCSEVINVITAGASFGDLAIVNDSKRTTTCIAKNEVELFVVSKSDYVDLSLRQSRQSYQSTKHFAFCKTVGVLKYWPVHLLESQPETCKVSFFRPNAVVVKDSRKSSWIYIVMAGSCRVVKRFADKSEPAVRNTRRRRTFPGEPPQPSKLVHVFSSEGLTTRTNLGQRLPPVSRKTDAAESQVEQNHPPRSHHRHSHHHTFAGTQVSHEEQPPMQQHRKQFLVQLQLLQPKDIFGLSSVIYDDEPSVTLVSNGAELVMVSTDFILQYLNEGIRNKLRKQIVRFPSQEAMLKRIREHQTWSIYKQTMVNQVRRRV